MACDFWNLEAHTKRLNFSSKAIPPNLLQTAVEVGQSFPMPKTMVGVSPSYCHPLWQLLLIPSQNRSKPWDQWLMGMVIAKKGKNLYSHSCPANSKVLCAIFNCNQQVWSIVGVFKRPFRHWKCKVSWYSIASLRATMAISNKELRALSVDLYGN